MVRDWSEAECPVSGEYHNFHEFHSALDCPTHCLWRGGHFSGVNFLYSQARTWSEAVGEEGTGYSIFYRSLQKCWWEEGFTQESQDSELRCR